MAILLAVVFINHQPFPWMELFLTATALIIAVMIHSRQSRAG